jgi:hypothetical protein
MIKVGRPPFSYPIGISISSASLAVAESLLTGAGLQPAKTHGYTFIVCRSRQLVKGF